MDKKIQMMVGPTTTPNRVLAAMNYETISHRSAAYTTIQESVTSNLKKLFNTKNDVLVLTSSGTGAMEAALLNCFSPNDEIVVPIIGKFSNQFAEMAERYNLDVRRVDFELGETADVETVMKAVKPSTKGVIVVHNESSTGVFNDLEAFGKALKDTETLLITDSVSGLAGLEIKCDEWNIDIALTSSQKALMAPPGLAFITLSDKAWARVEESKFPKYYFDLKLAREFNEINQTLTTPAISTLIAVNESLKMMLDEGLDNVYLRHKENTELIIKGVKDLGIEILPKDEKFASPTLTAIHVPGKSKYYVEELAKRDIIVNGGLPPVAEDVFRVGTMGYISKNDVVAFLTALEEIVKNDK